MGAPGLDFQTWDTGKVNQTNETRRIEVYGSHISNSRCGAPDHFGLVRHGPSATRADVSSFVRQLELIMSLILEDLHDLVFTPQGYFWENNCCISSLSVGLTHFL